MALVKPNISVSQARKEIAPGAVLAPREGAKRRAGLHHEAQRIILERLVGDQLCCMSADRENSLLLAHAVFTLRAAP